MTPPSADQRVWRLLLLGFGTVGQGVAARLRAAASELLGHGCVPRIVGVVDPVLGSVACVDGLDPGQLLEMVAAGTPLSSYAGARSLGDALEAIESVDADIVLEMTPTNLRTGEPGLGHVRRALELGRHVCTTNKGPVALAWRELSRLAGANGVQLRCEGTVLSGTPVFGLVEGGLAGAGVESVRGVVNGTCNFMLGEMEAGRSYDEALGEAQRLGYAETDPSGDVEGWDAAAKIAILGNLVLGADLSLGDVERRGIVDLDSTEVQAAVARGRRWRLVGGVGRSEQGWRAFVEPRLLDAGDPLATVSGPTNLLVFDTEALGEVTIIGPGAGREATGHALISDLLAIHRNVAGSSV